jgi:hypothetical protein
MNKGENKGNNKITEFRTILTVVNSVIVRFVDIGGIAGYYCLTFLFMPFCFGFQTLNYLAFNSFDFEVIPQTHRAH